VQHRHTPVSQSAGAAALSPLELVVGAGRMRLGGNSPSSRASATPACVAAGVAWLCLVPAVWLYGRGTITYDGYFRIAALPLALLVLAFVSLRALWPPGARAAFGYWVTLAGFSLAFAGVTLEFWGGWVIGEVGAETARLQGVEAWWGARAGSQLFLLGFFALAVGGATAAVALRREGGWPVWPCVVIGLSSIGVIMLNVLHDASVAAAVVGLGTFACGWIALGAWLGRTRPALACERPEEDGAAG